MLVNEAACRRLVRGGERFSGLNYVRVDDRTEILWRVRLDQRGHHQKELRLTLVQVEHRLDEKAHVTRTLSDEHRRRMLARARQPWTVRRTRDLDQTLGAAADGTNLLAESRTAAAGFSTAAQRANHGWYCI